MPTTVFCQIVVLCWNHALYDAIIYVYNKGMKDYTTPLEELLAVLETAVNTGKQLTGRTMQTPSLLTWKHAVFNTETHSLLTQIYAVFNTELRSL